MALRFQEEDEARQKAEEEEAEAIKKMEAEIDVLKQTGDKSGEATKRMQLAEKHMDLNHWEDAVRELHEALPILESLGQLDRVERSKELLTKLYATKGKTDKAPYRSEAVMALKSYVRAIEARDLDQIQSTQVDLDRTRQALKDSEFSNALESLFDRDPSALAFCEQEIGLDVSRFKVQQTIYHYPHNAFYLQMLMTGMGFGPQFRGVHPHRMGKRTDPNVKVLAVAQLPETESWQGTLQYRPGIMDAGIQKGATMMWPPE